MEPFSDAQVLARIEKPLNKAALDRGQRDNDRQRFHALLATEADDAGPYVGRLMDHIREILPDEDKQKRFRSLLRFPVPSARIVDSAADEYGKIFDADDRLIEVECVTDEQTASFREYLDTEVNLEDWLQKTAFNQNLRSSNSIWYADLPSEANAEGYPSPELLIRTFGQLHDLDTDRKGRISLVIAPMSSLVDADGKESIKRWAVLDSSTYRVIHKPVAATDPTVFLTNPHLVGRCPAGFVCHQQLDESSKLRRESPLHAVFDELDQLVIGRVFSRHADLYASFPILWQYKTKCDYHNEQGDVCAGGYTTYDYGSDNARRIECPQCAKRKPLGPGSVFRVPPPTSKEDSDNREPLGFVNADPVLLEYNLNKLDALEKQLKEGLTGDAGIVDQTAQAVNKDQVAARVDRKRAIASYWASETEITHSEIIFVLGRLRHGNGFISANVSYGREHQLLSLNEAELMYTEALKTGLPSYLLAVKRKTVAKLIAGASARTQLRIEILGELEPYPDASLIAIDKTTEEYELKANFDHYIAKFERQYIPIEQVAGGQNKQRIIDFIEPILYSYVRTTIAKRPKPEELGIGKPKPANA